jgi:cytochrome P450
MYFHHRIFTLDSRAVSHIMANPYTYEKPLILRRVLKRYMSEGLIIAEGHRHKVQRKIVQRLFSRNALRFMGEVVEHKTNEVVSRHEVWAKTSFATSSSSFSPTHRRRTRLSRTMTRATKARVG